MAQLLGIIGLVWKGRSLAVEKGASIRIGGLKNNAVVYGRQVGRAQEMEASEVKAVIPWKRGDKLVDVFTAEEGELQVLCDTGQTYVAPDAFITNRPMLTGGEGGKVEVIWSFAEPEEVVVG